MVRELCWDGISCVRNVGCISCATHVVTVVLRMLGSNYVRNL